MPKITPTFEASRSAMARGLRNGIACGTTELHVLRPRESLNTRFLFYLTHSRRFLAEGTGAMQGVAGQKRVPEFVLAEHQIDVPSLKEQKRIADFLDRETARIDTLISQKRRLIQLSEERLRASITGSTELPDAPRAPLGRFIARIDQGYSPVCDADPASDGWGVLKLSAVHKGQFRPHENKAMRREEAVHEEYRLSARDVLVSRANTPELVGDVCLVSNDPGRVLLPDLIYRIQLRTGLDPRFLVYVMLSAEARRFIESVARGSSQSMVKLRGEDLRSLVIPLPSHREQQRIADHLDSLTSWRDRLVRLVENQIGVLGEHRQALITAAVTAQLDLSDEAA
ncbi:MAG: restriction endonuclease subunit S [Actinomycetota bacterium]